LRAKACLARELSRNASDRQAEANLLSYAADLDREADELEHRESGAKVRSASGTGSRN
jgi:hypothetical protein